MKLLNKTPYSGVLILLAAFSLTVSYVSAAPSNSYFTTETLTIAVDSSTTITRTALTVAPQEYLKAVLPSLPEPNASIVRILQSYPQDGTHTYWWPRKGEASYDGATTDIVVNGQLLMTGEPRQRTFCCGLTLEVFYRYLQQYPGKLAALEPKAFKDDWFCRAINSPGPLDALNNSRLGTAVTDWNQALPGDFVQLWRTNKSGHSVIFINWVYGRKGERIGIQYWSTQTSTNGIGFRTELFGNLPGVGLMDEKLLSVARPSILN